MQGLADGYFILPYTIGNYLNQTKGAAPTTDRSEFTDAVSEVTATNKRFLDIGGKKPVDLFHRELGLLMWNNCGMARSDASLREALTRIPQIREEFWSNLRVLGQGSELNQSLEKAGRVADFIEFAELLCTDALNRTESCGGHFRVESQTPDGEAKRNDKDFCYVAAWEYAGHGKSPTLHKEPLAFENVHLTERSYK